tara:strand:+ start:1378 stop:1584 length:207 start_codon:yes stop_codon:yes gene_type:complete
VPDKSNLAQLFTDNYWLTIVTLIKAGVPWELISTMTDKDMGLLLGTLQAITDYEQEVQNRESHRMQGT